MADLGLKHEQVFKILEALFRDYNAASFEQCDAICYGGDIEKLSRQFRHVERVLKAFPKATIDGYNALLLKQRADKLRAQADAIERGEA